MGCGRGSEGESPSRSDAGLDAHEGRALLQPGHSLLSGFQSRLARRPQRRPCGERHVSQSSSILLWDRPLEVVTSKHCLRAPFCRGGN